MRTVIRSQVVFVNQQYMLFGHKIILTNTHIKCTFMEIQFSQAKQTLHIIVDAFILCTT